MFFLALLGGLGVVAIAGSLSGCGGTLPTPRDPLPPPDKPPPNPPLDFSETDNAMAYWTYKKLVEVGTSPRDMDRGYFRVLYPGVRCPTTPKDSLCMAGAGDGKLSAEEILDFVFSDLDNFSTSLENVLGRPLPWQLNDFNPETAFDETIRNRIKETIAFLDTTLQKQGLQKDSAEYQERMAVGLYFLVAMPDADKIKKDPKVFDDLTKEIEALKLGELKPFLLEHGGIRITGPDHGVELSALEALQLGKGKSTEHSKVLYAALRMARLPAAFAYVNPWKSEEPYLKVGRAINPSIDHLCVAVKIGERYRLLDSNVASAKPAHGEFIILSPRHFLAFEYLNRGALLADRGDFKGHANAWEMSRNLDPHSPFLTLNEGLVALLQNKPEEAVKKFDRSLQLYPQYALAHYSRANVRVTQKNWEAAEQDYSSALQAAPEFIGALQNRAFVKDQRGDSKGAMQDYETLISLRPAEGYLSRGTAYAKREEYYLAMADLNKALELNPRLAEAYANRGMIFAAKGEMKKANADFLQLFRLAPSDASLELVVNGLGPHYTKKWAEPQRKATLDLVAQETGIDAVKAELWMKVTELIWEAGHKQGALKNLKPFALEIHKAKKQMAASKKQFSPATQGFLRQLLESLPRAMRKEGAVQDLLKEV